MTTIEKMQQSDQVVHIITERQAAPLLNARLVRRTTIDPAPPRGKVAVNLTAIGRAHRGAIEAPEPLEDGVTDND